MTKEEFLTELVFDVSLGEEKSEQLLQFVLEHFNAFDVSESWPGESEISSIATSLVNSNMCYQCGDEYPDYELIDVAVDFNIREFKFELSDYDHESRNVVEFCKKYIDDTNAVLALYMK